MGEGEVADIGNMPKVLRLEFIGGPHDGAFHEIPTSAREWFFPVPVPPVGLGSRHELEDALPALDREVYVYRKTSWRRGGVLTLVMHYEGVTKK